MGAPAHCPRCDAPYADRTGRDPCPRCGAENPSIRLEADARAKAELDALEAKFRASQKAESQRARAVEEAARVMRGAPTAGESVAAKAAQVGSAVAGGFAFFIVLLVLGALSVVGALLVLAGFIEGLAGPFRPVVLIAAGVLMIVASAQIKAKAEGWISAPKVG